MEYKRGRYSWLLRPILITFDLIVINFFAFNLLNFNDENLYFFSLKLLNNKNLLYAIYSTVLWLTSTYFLNFYKVYRHTSILHVVSILFRQFLIYSIIVFAFLGVFRSIDISAFVTLRYLLYSFAVIGLVKIVSYYVLKTFRLYLKGNLRNVIIVGRGESIEELTQIFTLKKELGYNLKGVFGISEDKNTTGTIAESFSFLEKNQNIDEIYCAIDDLSEKEVNEYVRYANMHHCNIKFVPNRSKLFTKRLRADYYNYIPVLSIEEGVLNDDFNKIIKRSFDIVFSLFIIIFILSWLSIILFILIKIESKGPLFYRHKRNGINYKEFYCYKYRSLTITNEVKGTYVKQKDSRVTTIGRFLRKTSMDELPQFINVLKGDMSVVGPRPHMLSYTDAYSKKIDKYNFIYRHHVKPGITGLAQVKGYRGEVETDTDIINRIKYDIFYIENWSLLLDLKIIFQTLLNIIHGDEKAY
ncbi:putative colanic acid biosynthesis UDP-glucose lipid carrier transferase [Mariniflexile fucanivorans]|uniref:Putative colanic acid biosynthesis UDP-glucose lipid carrier transferase n=1 Tax=Mariniflexile fucanivorans TaxID=264023 RepID=A0A4V2QES9_9FLAO|nr:exopolysaccharide biosynthesis polyprenyl glycosylphosphotransferase [Mariniflexile fucanivorans]TCL69227.1 putative colanic acid biosynthesis UDP-glucose lipid carrier transferase [Mariniflexile fucanivorans]